MTQPDAQETGTYKAIKKWVPNEHTHAAGKCGLRARWLLAYPLQRVVFQTYTVGEVVMAVLGVTFLVLIAVTWDTQSSGTYATFPLILTFATAARNSPLTFLFGVPFERRVAFHRVIAVFANLCAILHGIVAFAKGDPSDTTGAANATSSNYDSQVWTGAAGTACALLLWVTAFYIIRRKFFDVFYYSHWVFFSAYIVFLIMHSALMVLVGVALWVLDVIFRNLYMAAGQPKKGVLQHIDGTDIVEVSMEGVKYEPGQYAFIALPEIGLFQWHPISFSTAPCEGPVAKFHIRCGGNWGTALMELAKQSAPKKEHTVLVDGAYGNTSIDIDSERYEHFLFVAGGIGITPLRSIATSIIDQKQRGRSVKQLEMHWSVRDGVAQAVPLKAEHGVTLHYTGGELGTVDGSSPHNVQVGRMDVGEVVKEFKARVGAGKGVRVAVLFCGPGAMFTPLRMACKEHSDSAVAFDLHTETFEF